MAKETPKSVALTTQTMEEAGIKSTISQNDIIDLVVSEHVEKIREQVEALSGATRSVVDKFAAVINGHRKKFLKELQDAGIVPVDTEIDRIRTTNSNTGGNLAYAVTLSMADDQHSKVDGMIRISQHNSTTIPTIGFDLFMTYHEKDVKSEVIMKGVTLEVDTMKIWKKSVKVSDKTMAEIRSALVEANENCVQFYKMFPDGRFNPNKMAKEAKNKMNKKILRNQAPGIADQLSSIFGMEF